MMAEIIDANAGLNATFPVPRQPLSAAPAASVNEDYLFVEARHPNTVLQGLNSLRLNNAFCDVTLCCGGQEFPCHRIVLASFSSYFQVKCMSGKQGCRKFPPR
ncbi:kelch-like protein 25 [Thalassophryne amazonica]|uniref:kelch-like protein 25 n=1 Tax=Thalassophryne amazonica TaxID=390379 RepID=UPI0014717AED|nr:kelch-like protein 25 [Thalassophryne amazonica]XP_034045348.1 kelch-like protein 25 [Thalassophryne amazonica]